MNYIRTDKNGTKIYEDWTCPRCGGKGGADCWAYTGWTCYECGGSGRAHKPQIIKVYTEEYQQKLNERNAKRLEKKRQEALKHVDANIVKMGFGKEDDEYVIYRVVGNTYAIRDALKELGCRYAPIIGWYSSKELADYETQRMTFKQVAYICDNGSIYFRTNDVEELFVENIRKAERKAEIAKTSQYVGNVGDKITVEGVAKLVGRWETSFLGHEVTTLKYVISDNDGNQYTWTTSSGSLKQDETITISAIVKAHNEYQGIKQTALKNCKVRG